MQNDWSGHVAPPILYMSYRLLRWSCVHHILDSQERNPSMREATQQHKRRLQLAGAPPAKGDARSIPRDAPDNSSARRGPTLVQVRLEQPAHLRWGGGVLLLLENYEGDVTDLDGARSLG